MGAEKVEPRQSFTRAHGLWLVALAVFYGGYTMCQWSLAYIDFGDGNYMYISRQVADGVVIYRDLLAPQPPVHLFVGAAIEWVARGLGLENPLFAYRAFSLLLRLGCYAMVVALAFRAWGRPLVAVVAGAIYLWLPIGHWWAMGYQSEPLEILWLLLMVYFALRRTALGDVLAGIFAALSALTNATAAPFLLVLIIYALFRVPWRALRMVVPCVLLAGTVVGLMEWWTGGHFLKTVVFKQVGTYPPWPDLLPYIRNKLVGQGSKILALEGFFIFMAFVGLWRYLRESTLDRVGRGALGWFCVATLASVVYVTKGGTMDYIFSLGEPAVAVLAAGEIMAWVRRWWVEPFEVPFAGMVPEKGIKLAATALLALFALGPGLNFHALLWTRQAFELPEFTSRHNPHNSVTRIKRLITRHSDPGDPILAPPFYAYVANRTLWGHYSELFIWQISYRVAVNEGAGPDHFAIAKHRAMAEAIRERRMPIIILEMDQTGSLRIVREALRAAYRPLETRPLRTLNTRLGVFVPVPPDPNPEQAEQQTRDWESFEDRL